MNYKKYKDMIKNKFLACALLLGLTAFAVQAQPYSIVLGLDGPGTIVKGSGTAPFTTVADILTESETLTATPNIGAVFSHWELLQTGGLDVLGFWTGDSSTAAVTIFASEVATAYKAVAHFVNAPVDVTVISLSSGGIPIGDPVPTHGVNAIPMGTVLYAGVRSTYPGNTGVRYACTGFTGTGDFISSSPNTNTTATITQPSTITWNWDTEYQLSLNTINGGVSTIDQSPAGRTWFKDGESITLTAQPATGYNFVRWDNAGGPVDGLTTATVQFNISKPENIAAVFQPYPNLSLVVISKDENNSHVAGYSYVGDTSMYHTYNTLMDISVDATVLNGSGVIREHCMGYTSTGGNVTPPSIANTEISAITPFAITADTTITLDWIREYRIRIGIAGTASTNGYDVSYSSYSPHRTYTTPPWFQAGDSVTISAASLTAGEVFLQWDSSPFGIDPYAPVNTFTVSGSANINARFASADLDSDLDGMPDIWESRYGLDGTDARDASEDPDNDGLSNLQEYIIGEVLLAAGTVPTDISPIDADSDDDGMIDGYEYNHIVVLGASTPVGQSQNALAVVSTEGDNGQNGNPDGDFHWDTNDGYEDFNQGLLNIEEYYGPDNVAPYNLVIVYNPALSILPIVQAQVNPLDAYDTSWSDTTDSESSGGTSYGDGFDDGFEYTWDQWQGGHGGESAGDPMNHVVPDRFGVPGLPISVVNADVNDDGIQDLIVACFGQELISVLLGNGSSGFAAPVTYVLGTGVSPVSIVAEDFNADDFIDIVTANADGSYSVLFGTNDMANIFPVINNYPLGTAFIALETADLDGVNGPDLVFADSNNALYVALNDGAGDFSATTYIGLTSTPGDIKLAPIYNGRNSAVSDLVVTLANDTIEIFANTGSGVFASTTVITLPAFSTPGACDVADFDDNGYNDIATVCTGDDYVRVYLNFDGSGLFNMSDSFFVQANAGLVDITAGDFTTYGNTNPSITETIDLVVVSYNFNSVLLYAGNGLGKFGNSGTLSTAAGPSCALLAELRTANRYLDLIIVESLTDSLVEFLNDGAGFYSAYSQFDVSSRIVDRRFNPAVIHVQDDAFGRPDYDLVYHIESGRAVEWFTDFYEYNASQAGGQIVGPYLIPQIVGASASATAERRSSHPFYWDADGDSLPDGWELAYGYDPWFVATYGGQNDGTDNPDGDWYAVAGDLKHKEVYDANGFNPSTGYGYLPPWHSPGPNTAEFNNYQELLGRSDRPAIMPNDPNDGGTCPIALDADNDGVWDGWELYVGMDPNDDTDAGLNWDYKNAYWWAIDTGDGLVNLLEFESYATSTNDVNLLTRVVGWYNKTLPTDPNDFDTDWDQVVDGYERGYFNFNDTANGGGLCPTAVDTDGDRIPDIWEANYPGGGDTNIWAGGMNGTARDAYLDYDGDGLLNYQEYFTTANHAWRYDKYIANMGAEAYDPYDFFSGGIYGRMVKTWDPSYFLDPPNNRVNLQFVLGSEAIIIPVGAPRIPYFSGTSPRDVDSDSDGMNDYWEVFHGLNPMYGYNDLVYGDVPIAESFPPWVSWHIPRDFNQTPWIVGFPNFDVDQDGLDNYEEGIYVDAIPYHHTDPSSMWMTDISAELSYANLYYWTGTFYSNFEWYWGDITYSGTALTTRGDTVVNLPPGSDNDVIFFIYMAPRFAYSYEINEGYDTDNDGISDYDELNNTVVSPGVTDPLNNMSPNINRALYLNGEAYTKTPLSYGWGYPDYRTYTVEAWVRAEELPTAKKQIVVQRAGYLTNADQFNPNIFGWRRNFELGLTPEGLPYILFDTPEGTTVEATANFAVETDKWYHISGTYEGDYNSQNQWVGKLNIYLDGILVKSVPASTMPANSYQGGAVTDLGSMTFSVGDGWQEADPSDYYFKGWVDNVRAWGVSQSQDAIQNTMMTTFDRTVATIAATNLETRLLYSFSFNDLPDPNIDNITPDGFDALVGYPANYTSIPFWRSMADRSKVYNDYKYLPWIDNQSLHYPRPVPSDTIIPNYAETNYPNTSDPYGYKYLTGTVLDNTQDPKFGPSLFPSYEDIIHPDVLANVPFEADMLPMLYAVTTESVAMWDNTAARNLDSDGDGMTDLWESAMGLDPNDATGVNGAYGDYDRDGLANIYEYQADTSPLECYSITNSIPDFFAWGKITGELNHDYRTFGELLTDHDMMEDEWETLNGLSPFLFDAFKDADGDGWSNYSEFRFGSDPQDHANNNIPLPDMYLRFKYSGDETLIPPGTVLQTLFYTNPERAPDCMMPYIIGMSGGIPTTEAVQGNVGTVNNFPVLPGSVVLTDSYANQFADSQLDGNLYSTTGIIQTPNGPMPIGSGGLGNINYLTGAWSYSGATGVLGATNIWGLTATSITYSSGGNSDFPIAGVINDLFTINFSTLYAGTREGLNTIFVFADLNDDGIWDPSTEPAGSADNGPIMLKGGTPEIIDISLKDYAPGFGRFAWMPDVSAVGYRLSVAKGAYQLFSVDLDPRKYFFMENDFMEFYGNAVPEGTITWTIDVLTQSGAYSNSYATGSFDVGYPSYIEVPTIVYPSTGVKCSNYRTTFTWDNADKVTPFYELQIAEDAAFNSVVLSKAGYIPVDYAEHSQITLPEIGSGFEWDEKTYYWRVRNKTSVSVGTWSSVEAFRIDYEADSLYTHSISGVAYYTGKAKTGNIIVEAYGNDSFSGTPLSIDVIVNNPLDALWPLNPYEYNLPGLPDGTYYVRAFLDQNNNYLKDDFETYGYFADGTDIYTVQPIALNILTGDVDNKNIFTVVADTDDDMLADDWEWSYLGTLTIVGAGEVRGFTDYDGNGVNDFEAYAWSALNMSPIDGAVAGDDQIPYIMKVDFGLAITDPVEILFSNIYLDGKYGQVYVVWHGLGGASNVSVEQNSSSNLSLTSGNSTVEYVLQSSRDLVNWVDVDTAAGATYYPNTDMFIYSGEVPEINAENNKPVFYRFKVRW